MEVRFDDAIKIARTLLGYTQDELASLVGVDQATVSRWEDAKSSPYAHEDMRVLCILLYKIAETRHKSLTTLRDIDGKLDRLLTETSSRINNISRTTTSRTSARKCGPPNEKYASALALAKYYASAYTKKTQELCPDEQFGTMVKWFRQVKRSVAEEKIRLTIDFFFAHPKRTMFGFPSFRAKFSDLVGIAVGTVGKSEVGKMKGWICPECGYENRHNGGFCLQCRYEKV